MARRAMVWTPDRLSICRREEHRRGRWQHRVGGLRRFAARRSGKRWFGSRSGLLPARGKLPTLTDACVTLGYIDPDYFAGGRIKLAVDAARAAIDAEIAYKLGISVDEAAEAIVQISTENMVGIIEEITINQGVDPRGALLVGGGGAAGLNSVRIAQRLGCNTVLIPETGAALSAAGALMSDLSADFAATFMTSSDNFDYAGLNLVLSRLQAQASAFANGPGANAIAVRYEFYIEARYENQVWDLEMLLPEPRITVEADLARMMSSFHQLHHEVFAISEPGTAVTVNRLRVRVNCTLRNTPLRVSLGAPHRLGGTRAVHFPETGRIEVPVAHSAALNEGESLQGPIIIESPVTTVVVTPGATVTRTHDGGLAITVETSLGSGKEIS